MKIRAVTLAVICIVLAVAILVGSWVGLRLVLANRASLARTAAMNQMHMLVMAMQGYEGGRGHFPPRAMFGKDGKPLLSWRVAILPYLDQDDLYKQFHLDEPWDSANNRPLIAKMPAIFNLLGEYGEDVSDGKTHFVVPVGKSTVFDDKPPPAGALVSAAAGSIVMVVADDGVAWTAPEDYAVGTNGALNGLGGIWTGGFPVASHDGPVLMVPKTFALSHADFFSRGALDSIDLSKIP
jgi:hypothetical protein